MSKIVNYVSNSYNELMHKVSWPSYAKLQEQAILVFVASLIIALIVFLMDFIGGVQPGIWKGILGFVYDILA